MEETGRKTNRHFTWKRRVNTYEKETNLNQEKTNNLTDRYTVKNANIQKRSAFLENADKPKSVLKKDNKQPLYMPIKS